MLENKIIPVMCFILGLSICVSTALMSASYVVIVVLIVFSAHFKAKLKEAFSNKFVLFSFLFYMVFIIAALWNVATVHDSYKMLTRIHGYLLAPLLYIAFQTNNSARYLLRGFLFGAVLSAVLSLLSYLFNHHILYGIRDNTWVVFHGHILHNAFLAIAGVFLLLGALLTSVSKKMRILFAICYFICLIDALFIVVGRTGQVLYLILSLFILVYHFRFKGVLIILALSVVIGPLLYMSPVIKTGIKNYQSDMSKYNQGDTATSMGARLVFHQVSTQLIKQKILIGYGTGSFTKVYKDYITTHNIKDVTTNPHRDILWIGVETGLLGIIIFALMIISAINESLKLSYYFKGIGLSLILGYLLASIQNSFFIDNVTGMSFVFILLGIIVMGKFNTNPKKM